MNRTSVHLTSKIVDGGEILVPDQNGWHALHVNPSIEADPVGFLEEIPKVLAFVREYSPQYILGLYQPRYRAGTWLPMTLLQTPMGWQRVFVERLTCPVCHWQGKTANPMLSDLYLGVADQRTAMHRAAHHPIVDCPKCGNHLPRHPIWTEPYPLPGSSRSEPP